MREKTFSFFSLSFSAAYSIFLKVRQCLSRRKKRILDIKTDEIYKLEKDGKRRNSDSVFVGERCNFVQKRRMEKREEKRYFYEICDESLFLVFELTEREMKRKFERTREREREEEYEKREWNVCLRTRGMKRKNGEVKDDGKRKRLFSQK